MKKQNDDRNRIVSAALNVAYAMMAKGVYQYPLGNFDIDRMSKEAVLTAKRLIQQIENEVQ